MLPGMKNRKQEKEFLTNSRKTLKLRKGKLALCQDCGLAVVFVEMGQEVCLEGETLEAAVNQGVREGYRLGYLRKSVVRSPLDRVNTGDNTPAILHVRIVPGNQLRITVAAKGAAAKI